MDMKRIAVGAVVGVVALQVAGFLLFQVALFDFFLGHRSAVPGAFKEPALYLAFALGDLMLAIFLSLAIVVRDVPTVAAGAVTGAVTGFLVWLGVDLITYGYANLWSLTATVLFPVFGALQWGIAGAAIAAVLARVPASSAIRPAE